MASQHEPEIWTAKHEYQNCYALGDVRNVRSNRLMDNFDITDLISVSRQGDDGAKSQLVGHFRDYLRLLAHIHVKPLLQAKFDESDIVQETCLQAALSFDQFRRSKGCCAKVLTGKTWSCGPCRSASRRSTPASP